MQKLGSSKLLRLAAVPSSTTKTSSTCLLPGLCQCSRFLASSYRLHGKFSLFLLKTLETAMAQVTKKMTSRKGAASEKHYLYPSRTPTTSLRPTFSKRRTVSEEQPISSHSTPLNLRDFPLPLIFESQNKHNKYLDIFKQAIVDGKFLFRLLISTEMAEALKENNWKSTQNIRSHFGARCRITKTTSPEAVFTIVCDFDKITDIFKKLLPLLTQCQPFEETELRLLLHRIHAHFLVGPKGQNMILMENLFNSFICSHRLDCPQSTERVVVLSGSQEDVALLVAQIAAFLKNEVPPINKFQARKMYNPAVLKNLQVSPSVYGGYGQEGHDITTVNLSIPNWLARAHFLRNFNEIRWCHSYLSIKAKVNVGKGTEEEENSRIELVGSPHKIQAAISLIKKSLRRTRQGCGYLREDYEDRGQMLRLNKNRRWWHQKTKQMDQKDGHQQKGTLSEDSSDAAYIQSFLETYSTDSQGNLIINCKNRQKINWKEPSRLKNFCNVYELKTNVFHNIEHIMPLRSNYCPQNIQKFTGSRIPTSRVASKEGKGDLTLAVQGHLNQGEIARTSVEKCLISSLPAKNNIEEFTNATLYGKIESIGSARKGNSVTKMLCTLKQDETFPEILTYVQSTKSMFILNDSIKEGLGYVAFKKLKWFSSNNCVHKLDLMDMKWLGDTCRIRATLPQEDENLLTMWDNYRIRTISNITGAVLELRTTPKQQQEGNRGVLLLTGSSKQVVKALRILKRLFAMKKMEPQIFQYTNPVPKFPSRHLSEAFNNLRVELAVKEHIKRCISQSV